MSPLSLDDENHFIDGSAAQNVSMVKSDPPNTPSVIIETGRLLVTLKILIFKKCTLKILFLQFFIAQA